MYQILVSSLSVLLPFVLFAWLASFISRRLAGSRQLRSHRLPGQQSEHSSESSFPHDQGSKGRKVAYVAKDAQPIIISFPVPPVL